MSGTASLVERQTQFVAALREAGLAVSVAESLDAARATTGIELTDRTQLRAALATTLVKRQVQRPVFDSLFDLFYPLVTGATAAARDDAPAPARDPDAAPRGPNEDPGRDRLRARLAEYLQDGGQSTLDGLAYDAVEQFGALPGRSPGTTSWSRVSTLQRMSAATLMSQVLANVLHGQDRGGLAEQRARTAVTARIGRFEQRVAAEVNRRLAEQGEVREVARTAARPTLEQLPFLGATRADLAALRRQVVPLARRLAARLTVEQRRGRRGTLDFRRTVRSALSTGGVPMDTVHRPKRPTRTDLVVLCDLSESVASFAHFTLLLVYALREQFTRVRAFGFVDELDELTRFFAPGTDVVEAVTRLTSEADVTWVLGRTDYGRALELFAHRHDDAVGPRSSLLVLGDARSNYGSLALPVFAELAGRARHAYWLNPERRSLWDTGDSRAGEYSAIAPMVECRNLEQLTAFVADLGRAR